MHNDAYIANNRQMSTIANTLYLHVVNFIPLNIQPFRLINSINLISINAPPIPQERTTAMQDASMHRENKQERPTPDKTPFRGRLRNNRNKHANRGTRPLNPSCRLIAQPGRGKEKRRQHPDGFCEAFLKKPNHLRQNKRLHKKTRSISGTRGRENMRRGATIQIAPPAACRQQTCEKQANRS